LTALVRKLAAHRGFVSSPVKDRYHQAVIPLGGGIAIFTTLVVFIIAAMATVKFLTTPGHLQWLTGKISRRPRPP